MSSDKATTDIFNALNSVIDLPDGVVTLTVTISSGEIPKIQIMREVLTTNDDGIKEFEYIDKKYKLEEVE